MGEFNQVIFCYVLGRIIELILCIIVLICVQIGYLCLICVSRSSFKVRCWKNEDQEQMKSRLEEMINTGINTGVFVPVQFAGRFEYPEHGSGHARVSGRVLRCQITTLETRLGTWPCRSLDIEYMKDTDVLMKNMVVCAKESG